jgi:hypothetical protein
MVKSSCTAATLVLQIACLSVLMGCGDAQSSVNTVNRAEQSATNVLQSVEKDSEVHSKADENVPPIHSVQRMEAINAEVAVPDTSLVRTQTIKDPLQTIDYPWSLRIVGKQHYTDQYLFKKRKFVSVSIDDRSCSVVSDAINVSLQRVRNEITGYEREKIDLPEGRNHIFLLREKTGQPILQDLDTLYPPAQVAKSVCGLPRGIAIDKMGLPLGFGSSYAFGPEGKSLTFTSVKASNGTYQVTVQMGTSSQELLPAYRWMPHDQTQRHAVPVIVWVGSVNKDEVPDFILKHSIYADYDNGDFSLFISSYENESIRFREMARARTVVM